MRKKILPGFVTLLLFSLLLISMVLGIANSQTVFEEVTQYIPNDKTAEECLSFAKTEWVLKNVQTGEIGVVVNTDYVESSGDALGTCIFKVEFKDGSFENKVVLSKSSREKLRELQKQSQK